MKKLSDLLSARRPYFWALVSSLILVILVASFTTIPQAEMNQMQGTVLAASDVPSYCTAPSAINVVNKYGRKTVISDNAVLYRVAGDRMNLALDGLPLDSEVMPTVLLLSTDKQEVLYDRFGKFDATGFYSFYAMGGTYAIGRFLTGEQAAACGGSSAFTNTLEYKDGVFVIDYYLIINILQPTPQPRNVVNHAV